MTSERKISSSEALSMANSWLDPNRRQYQKKRISHWDSVSGKKENQKRPGAFYHRLLQHYYRFLIPPGLRILEVGCSHGDLLASLNPSVGVGIDFSDEMLQCAAKKHAQLFFIRSDAHELPI